MRKAIYNRKLEQALSLPNRQSETALRRLIQELLAQQDYPNAHDASFHLAAFLYESDKLTRAKKVLIPIVSNYMKYPFTPRYANMMMLLGVIELGEEDYTLANYYFQSGLKLAKKHRLPRVVFLAYSNLAIVNSALGCHEEALHYLLTAKAHSDSTNDDAKALLHLNLAVCYKLLGRLEESEQSIRTCVETYHGLEGGRRALIQCCQMDLYYKLGDMGRYEACKQQIISEGGEAPTPDRMQAYQMICENAVKANDLTLAQQMLTRLKTGVQGRGDLATQVFIERLTGQLAQHHGDTQMYIASLEKQLELNKQLSELNSQRLIESTGMEIRMAQLMRKNEEAQRAREQEQLHHAALSHALAAAQEANRAKSDFLARMSHDIRTPMNAIIGYLGIAKTVEQCPEKVTHCLDNSEIAAKHLLQLINDILDMSSIESGKMKIASEPFNLKREIVDASSIFYQTSKNKGVQFETRVSGVTQETVVGDPLRLNQIIMNLLSNAVKFTPVGGTVSLQITQTQEENDAALLEIAVRDTGIGMSQDYMSRLFQPFEQESAGTARQYGGSGLGLSIVHRLVTMMGGTIEVDSRQGEGSCFTVRLPFAQVPDAPRQVARADKRARVLLLCGEQDRAGNIKKELAALGIKADTIADGDLAVKRLRSRFATDYPYTLCLLDWNRFAGDSAAVAAAVKAETRGHPFLLCATGYDLTEFEIQARAAGVDSLAASPLFPSDLLALVEASLGGGSVSVTHKTPDVQMNLHGRHAILAEDNAMNMEIAVTMLEKTGLHISQAVNGEKAVKLYEASPEKTFDFILMDVQMPVMNGYEATRAIRASHHSDAKTIPIIAMTANAFSEDVAEALSHGMTAHIAKPVNYEKLYEILAAYHLSGVST